MIQSDITAIIKLVRHCGLQIAELYSLKKPHFDLKAKIINVKTDEKKRTAFIRPVDVAWFKKWLEDFDNKEWLFPQEYKVINRNLRLLGKSKTNDMLHRLNSEMSEMGASHDVIALKLGTAPYLENFDKEKIKKITKELFKFEKDHFPVGSTGEDDPFSRYCRSCERNTPHNSDGTPRKIRVYCKICNTTNEVETKEANKEQEWRRMN